MRLLSLDPAAATGFCFGSTRPEHYGVWQISHSGDRHPGQRLYRLRARLYEARREWQLEAIAYEQSSFGSPNPAVKELHSQLAAVVCLCACEFGVPVVAANIATVKAFACHGRASKAEMIAACRTHFGIVTTSSDVADAVLIWSWAQQHPDGRPTAKARAKAVRTQRRKSPTLFKR